MGRRVSKWKISKHAFYAALHYAYQFNEWENEYRELEASEGARAICYSDAPKSIGSIKSQVEEIAVKKADLLRKMDLVREAAHEADPEIYRWLLEAVTNEGVYYTTLLHGGSRLTERIGRIPCGRGYFYEKRRKFYYLLSSRI